MGCTGSPGSSQVVGRNMKHSHFMSNTGQRVNTPCAPKFWPGIICCPNTALIPRQGTQQSHTESNWHFSWFTDFSDCIHHHNLWRSELKSPSWSFTQTKQKEMEISLHAWLKGNEMQTYLYYCTVTETTIKKF